MKYLLLTIIFAAYSGISEAKFNRVWVGFKKKEITAAHFLNGLNATFFRDTINVGKGRGLESYQPYITNMSNGLPDELALVVYESEEKYRAIRSTPEGERYSAAHWDFFVKEESKSTVSVPFTGTLTVNGAFELKPEAGSWQDGETIVLIYRNKNEALSALATKFAGRKNEAGVRNSILLINDSVLIEYVSLTKADVKIRSLGEIIERKHLPRKQLSEIKIPVGLSEGVNFRF